MHPFYRLIGLLCLGFLVAQSSPESSAQNAAQSTVLKRDTIRVSLDSAVQLALESSPEIHASVAKRDFAGARLNYARAFRFLAEFEATSAHSTSPGLKNIDGVPTDALYLDPDVRNDWDNLSFFNRIDIKLTQPLFTWGEISGNVNAARHGVTYEEESVRSSGLEVTLRTGQLYYGLLLTKALSTLALSAQDIVSRAIVEIDSQIEEGASDVDDADLFQVRIAEQEVRRRVIEVEQNMHTLRSALARQMMLPEGTVPDPGDRFLSVAPFVLEDLSHYQEMAMANRPEMGQAVAGLAATRSLVDVARSDYYPKLFAVVTSRFSSAPNRYRQRNPYIGDAFLSRGLEAGIGFRQKLNFAQTSAKVEQARSQAAEVRFLGEAAQQLVLFEVEEAYRNVIIARSAVDTSDEALLLSKEWLQFEEINFDLDVGDTENLVRAVQFNLELQAGQNQAVHDYNVAVLKLLNSTGMLTQTIQSGTFVE